MDIYKSSVSPEQYITARYFLKSKTNLWDAAYNLAVGQSIGNPSIRNAWETTEMYEEHLCKILQPKEELSKLQEGHVDVAFPLSNINLKEDGVSQLLCFFMGGHLDIDLIECCHLVDISDFKLLSPTFGVSGLRKFTGVHDKPLLGGIIKPKTGLSPDRLLDVVKQLVENGVNFIKEDEILGNPACCPLETRVKLLQQYLHDKKVTYCYCINADYPYCIDRAKRVAEEGGNGVHINVWSGLGVYKAIRELNLPIAIHFQKSGDRIFTSPLHNHHVSWTVVCKLAGLMGVDTIHAGMWGGYATQDDDLNKVLSILSSHNVMPALSCGMHPGIVNKITKLFGNDYIANVGGAIHGHPGGTAAGVRAMRQAIDGDFGKEYHQAIDAWGLVE